MSRVFEAVTFDLDGVLADSEPWWNEIDLELLAEQGVNYKGEYHRDVLGVSNTVAVEFYKKAFNIPTPVEALMWRRGEIAAAFFADRIGLFPCAETTLNELRKMQLRLGLATSSLSASARPFLERTGIDHFFDVIVTGEEVQRGKPDPDIYLQTARRLGVPPDRCLAIEDALAGVAAAKGAHMCVAAIPDTRFVDRREYERKADYVLQSLSEIPTLVRRLSLVTSE
jgi:HAD superfamily hydrolase (TIGR01509 family)